MLIVDKSMKFIEKIDKSLLETGKLKLRRIEQIKE